MSYLPLANKYRPRTFSEVIGQDTTVTALKNALQTGNLASAYLLTGTRGIGKTTLARLIAMAVNCTAPREGFDPCGHCELCLGIIEGNNPDIYEIDGASKTKVEDMRTLLENTLYLPLISQKKVYIIDEVHMLSQHSFNALLKTLEEPAAHVLFILATTELEKIPVTIRSRCIHFSLLPCPASLIHDRCTHILEQEAIPYDDSLDLIVKTAHGSLRDALTLLEHARTLGGGAINATTVFSLIRAVPDRQWSDWLEALVHGTDSDALNKVLESIEQLEPNPKAFLDELTSFLFRQSLDDFKRYGHLYDIVLHALKQLPYAPSPTLHLQMTWIKLWHSLRHPPGEVVIKITHTTPNPEAKAPQPSEASTDQTFFEDIKTPPLPAGLLGAALKQIAPHPERTHDADGAYLLVYPEQHAALFTPSTLKKLQQWIHDKAPHIRYHLLPYAMTPSTDTANPTPTTLSDEEKRSLKTLGLDRLLD